MVIFVPEAWRSRRACRSETWCAGKGPAAVPTWHDLSLPFVRADIPIDIPRNVWFQGPSTAIELSGNMCVTKDLYSPFILSGSIETMRGYASYYGRRFTVESGRVTFTGTPELNPMLDVTVTQKVSDSLVSIQSQGGRSSRRLPSAVRLSCHRRIFSPCWCWVEPWIA